MLPTKDGWLSGWGIAFGCSPKCGTGSLRAALRSEGLDYWTRSPPDEAERRVFIVRHPLERFTSLWRNKCRNGGRLSRGKGQDNHPVSGMTPQALFDYALDNPNHHWTPQIVMYQRATLDVELVRLRSMSRWWQDFPHSTVAYPQDNMTHDKGDGGMSLELMCDVEEYYAEDLRLWQSAMPTKNN